MNRGRTRNISEYYSPRGRSPRTSGNSAYRQAPVGADRSSDDVPFVRKDKLPPIGRQTPGKLSTPGTSKQFDRTLMSDHPSHRDFPLPAVKDISSNIGNLKLVQNSPEPLGHIPKQSDCLPIFGSEFENHFPPLLAQSEPRDKHLNIRKPQSRQTSGGSGSHSSYHFVCPSSVYKPCVKNETSLPAESGIKDLPSKKETECGQTSHEKSGGTGRSDNSDPLGVPFDICLERNSSLVRLKAPLLVKNREKRKEIKRSVEWQSVRILRSGMILLKSYISCSDQVKIVQKIRELGRGFGGFYHPGYRDGTKLHLKMMCLGKNWDPETSMYDDKRPIDGAKPPEIPDEFHQLVKGAIQDSHACLQKVFEKQIAEVILPSMLPNICIVNFYANSGRLGLHQDKDETPESLYGGLPVVSFSIGDSAEFLYGDDRDPDKAEKVTLESGDVLIFGGKSRHIFHGVTAIVPNTAPKVLLEESNLRPGRLNLTFREY